MGRILVAIDGSRASREAARTGLEFAEYLSHQVTFVHVLPATVEPGEAPEFAAFEEACERYAEELVRQACRFGASSSMRTESLVMHGEPIDVLCDLAAKPEVMMVIVGARSRGPLARTLLGSVSGELIRRCSKPVLVVPERSQPAERAVAHEQPPPPLVQG